ncbi:group-specific protein [Oceanobacillus sp. FSL W7-1293]|uniref:group-specific protein n=1 Tax=Oceanobacillus sp. FSL W7-1293 TaxID=2921699 RepID=UPI0030D3710F
MGTGYIVSLVAVGVQIILILAVSIPFNRKYIVKENGKIDYKKTTVYLRWNVFDTVTIVVATYTILCTLLLFFLLANGEDIENAWVQFLSNQAQAWVIVTVSYFISRISMTLKSIKAHLEDKKDEV